MWLDNEESPESNSVYDMLQHFCKKSAWCQLGQRPHGNRMHRWADLAALQDFSPFTYVIVIYWVAEFAFCFSFKISMWLLRGTNYLKQVISFKAHKYFQVAERAAIVISEEKQTKEGGLFQKQFLCALLGQRHSFDHLQSQEISCCLFFFFFFRQLSFAYAL